MSEPTDNPTLADERPWEEPGSFRMDCDPHRGPLLKLAGAGSILLTVLCWVGTFHLLDDTRPWLAAPCVVWVVPGIVVWKLARQDLLRMRAGFMDPSGRKQTDEARVWGIVAMSFNAVLFFECYLVCLKGLFLTFSL